MTSSKVKPGEIIQLDAGEPAGMPSATLLKTERLHVVRRTVEAGATIPKHTAPGELIVHCLQGRVAFTCCDKTLELAAGQLLYLPPSEPHAVAGIEDAVLLLTIATSRNEGAQNDIDESSDESFPASDPPAWTGVTRP